MTELNFNIIGIASVALLLISAGLMAMKKMRTPAVFISVLAVMILTFYIAALWIALERPPLRTLGETRLWYGFFLALLSVTFWFRWKYVWLFMYSNLMAGVFLIIDLLKPAALDQTLMPALQSVWFVPHVIVYILGYALLGVAALVAVLIIIKPWIKKDIKVNLHDADNMIYLGFAFLTLGLVFGAMWAKTAWGHYWTWDPKETWAFITWMTYLMYIHIRHRHPHREKTAAWMMSLAFVFMMICWLGIQYLPSAQNSVHTY